VKPHFIVKLREPAINYFPPWQELVESRVVVKPPPFTDEVDELLREYNLQVLITTEHTPKTNGYWSAAEINTGLNRIYRFILLEGKEVPKGFLEQLCALPNIEYVRQGEIGETTIPRRSRVTSQSILLERSHELIHLKEAHSYSKGNPAIKVAILDTGIDMQHPEIIHAIEKGNDFVNIIDGAKEFIGDYLEYDELPEDEVGHGSHVAGIIASAGKKMPLGVVPQCKILAVRVLGAMKNGNELVGAGLIDNINTGIKWAVDNGANIINMSLGIKREGGGLPHQEVIAYALEKGATVVAASGNDGTNDKYYPGALKGVIAVGAVDENDEMASFSTFGDQVSFVAPGTNIYSSYKGQGYAFSSGTSQASPFVAGSIALLKSYAYENGKSVSDGQIKYILKNTSDKLDRRLKSEKWGYGRINLIDAIKLLNYKLNI
jgi:thermitase